MTAITFYQFGLLKHLSYFPAQNDTNVILLTTLRPIHHFFTTLPITKSWHLTPTVTSYRGRTNCVQRFECPQNMGFARGWKIRQFWYCRTNDPKTFDALKRALFDNHDKHPLKRQLGTPKSSTNNSENLSLESLNSETNLIIST